MSNQPTKRPKITVGMAHHKDLDSCIMTIQSLRIHQKDVSDVEIVLVDNSPDEKEGEELTKFFRDLAGNDNGYSAGLAGVKYVPFREFTGTTATRERIFAEASGEIVVVMDCHVLLWPDFLENLREHYRENPDCDDLLCGPLMFDSFTQWATQYNDVWSSEMWGVWGTAWQCGCSDESNVFTAIEPAPGTLKFVKQMQQWEEATACEKCGRVIPQLERSGFENHLHAAGFRPAGVGGKPIEVPAQGLGMFACRKAAWPGFNPHFRGFGGEEWYIHEKFRGLGRKVMLLDFMWWHKFQRVGGPKYRLKKYDKARNMYLGLQELGLPLHRFEEHFVHLEWEGDLAAHLQHVYGASTEEIAGKNPEELLAILRSKKLTPREWELLMADPIGNITAEIQASGTTFSLIFSQPPESVTLLEEIYEWTCNEGRDSAQHLAQVRALAEQCQSVAEITKRRESTVALLAAKPKELHTIQMELDALIPRAMVQAAKEDPDLVPWPHFARDPLSVEPFDCDMLFIDWKQDADSLFALLDRFGDRVGKYIVVRGTEAFGKFAEGSNGQAPGLLPGWKKWVETGSPLRARWKRAGHDPSFYGLTVFSCVASDRSIDYGPGTVLKGILAEIGFVASEHCSCNRLAAEMDELGPEGTEGKLAYFEEEMRKNQTGWGWAERFAAAKAAAKAVSSGLAWKVNWFDPIPSLIRLAIQVAREEEGKRYATWHTMQPDEPAEPVVYFDIDGVLNTTPARGNLGFGVDAEKCEILASLPGKKVCISFWRNNSADEVLLPFPFTFAPKGDKRKSHPGATIIIDDDPGLYDADAPVFAVMGNVGLTKEDGEKIRQRLELAKGTR